MTPEVDDSVLHRCPVCDSHFNKEREAALLKMMRQVEELQERHEQHQVAQYDASKEIGRLTQALEIERGESSALQKQITHLSEQLKEATRADRHVHKHHDHGQRVSLKLQVTGWISYLIVCAMIVAVTFYEIPKVPTDWIPVVFWILIFGVPSLVYFCFYSGARPLLSPLSCYKCSFIQVGCLLAILIAFWGLCMHLNERLQNNGVEVFLTVLGGLVVPEIANGFRRLNKWLRPPKAP